MSPDRRRDLNRRIMACERCPRLRAHCRGIARQKRAAFRCESYHGRPVPNFGDAEARLLIVGLAPAAHGANRTGRMFTGDRSGDFLYRAMHETGFASQSHATDRNDGLVLRDAMITAAVHCAPPGNRPTPSEMEHCRPFLSETVLGLEDLRVVLCLGQIAFRTMLRYYRDCALVTRLSGYRFGHGEEYEIPGAPAVLCSYHPSQQNTFTGRLTASMLRKVFLRARDLMETRGD